MADPVPQKAGNDAGHELQQADGRAVPAHTARPQFVRDEVCCERLANRAENALIESVEDKEGRDQQNVLRQRSRDTRSNCRPAKFSGSYPGRADWSVL